MDLKSFCICKSKNIVVHSLYRIHKSLLIVIKIITNVLINHLQTSNFCKFKDGGLVIGISTHHSNILRNQFQFNIINFKNSVLVKEIYLCISRLCHSTVGDTQYERTIPMLLLILGSSYTPIYQYHGQKLLLVHHVQIF